MSLLDSLVSYWQCDEASGNLLDAHGSNDLTDVNTVGSAAGKINNGRDFERANSEAATHADNADLSTGDIDFTFSLWFNPESMNNDQVMLAKASTVPVFEYTIRLHFDNKPEFHVVAAGGSASVAWGSTVSPSTWYHLVAIHDSVNNQIAIIINDGTPVTVAHTHGVRDGTGGFAFGREGDRTVDHWDGIIDEVGFWKRVLTSGEITQLYNGGSGLSYDDFGAEAAATSDSNLLCLGV